MINTVEANKPYKYNIVYSSTHYNDKRNISSLDLKVKSTAENNDSLIALVYLAFSETTLLADVGRSVKLARNPRRQNIVNLSIKFKENELSSTDIARFTEAFQSALDTTEAPY